MAGICRFLVSLLRRHKAERDLDEEIASCLDLLIEQHRLSGMSEEQAVRAARLEFGGTSRVKENVRDTRPGEALRRYFQDVRYAVRGLVKSKAFTLSCVLILALGIGANTAIFSILNAVLLRPLPYSQPDQLIRIRKSLPKMSELRLGAAPPEFLSYRTRGRVFSAVAGYQSASYDVTGLSQPQHVPASKITASLFQTLDVKPHIGRAFTASDEAPDAERVVLLSYAYWTRQNASDPHALSRTIRLDEQPYRIVGVMPPGFVFPFTDVSPGEPPALWVPLSFSSEEQQDWASSFDTDMIARLRPGMGLRQAQEDVTRVSNQFQREHRDVYSGNTMIEASAEPWNADLNLRLPGRLRMLGAAVAVVLLIACANVGNLLIARAAERQREISIRRALGASPSRLARQIFTETALLAMTATLLGCALAASSLRLVERFWSADLNFREVTLDVRVLSFTLLLSCLTCLVCGLLPAWAERDRDINKSLRQSGKQNATPSSRRLSKLLLVGEVACSVVLLVAAVSLLRSFLNVLDVPLGFDPENVLIVRTTFNGQRYASHARRRQAEREILKNLTALPETSSAALTTHVPLADERQIGFVVDGAPADEFHWADNALVSPNYFAVLRTRLLRGRTFSELDTPDSPAKAVINESMSRKYWPNQDAVGRTLRWANRPFQVVGIIADMHVKSIDEAVSPTIYFDAYQMETHTLSSAVFVIRTRSRLHALELSEEARTAIWSVDSSVPVLGSSTLREVVASSLAARSAALILAGGFAVLALILALAGIYSVFSHAIAQRTSEVGLRLALGAQPASILRLLLGEAAALTLWGVSAGAVASLLTARLLSNLLYGVPTVDPIAYLAGAFTLLVVALLGIYGPARRASQIDPLVALRDE